MKPVMFCLDFCVDPQQMLYILFKTVEFWKTVPQIVTNIHIGKDLIGDNHVFCRWICSICSSLPVVRVVLAVITCSTCGTCSTRSTCSESGSECCLHYLLHVMVLKKGVIRTRERKEKEKDRERKRERDRERERERQRKIKREKQETMERERESTKTF